MPSTNQRKEYKENAYYHIYNRGVGKMTIFHKEQDYRVFLHYLRIIFSPLNVLLQELNSLQHQYKQAGNGSRFARQIKRMQRAVLQAERFRIRLLWLLHPQVQVGRACYAGKIQC